MQRLLTGIDGEGHSSVIAREVPEPMVNIPGILLLDKLVETIAPPPERPAGNSDHFDIGVSPGAIRWTVIEFEPSLDLPMHCTDSIDFNTIISGSIAMILDDGVHELNVGDSVAMMGVDHAWRTGQDSCQMSVVSLGTPPSTQ